MAELVIIIGVILGIGRVAAGVLAAEYIGLLALTGFGAFVGVVGALGSIYYIYEK